jgi:Mn-dependent DtxR family transcriptional regulator
MNQFDNHTREGRAKIDGAVLKTLGKTPKRRAAIAEKLGLESRVVSASLRRLTADGRVGVNGSRGTTEYTRG